MRYSRYIMILITFSIIGIIVFYTYPLKINNIMPLSRNIEIMNIDNIYLSDGKSTIYEISNNKVNINDFINHLDSVSYHRRISDFQGGVGRVIMTDILYKDESGNQNMLSVYIHEVGTIKIEDTEYKIYGNTSKLIDNLFDWISSNGTLKQEL